MKVYLLVENGCWDFENTNTELLFKDYEKAKIEYLQKVKNAKEDMFENWMEEEFCEINEKIDDEKKYCCFDIYENGDYSRLHDTILLEEIEIIE